MKFIVNLLRILVGGLFVFSGLIKANDPMGFGFKLEEYFEVFGTHFMIPLAMALAIIICVFEVWLGVMLILGSLPKLTVRLSLAMIVFFTFLTFYSAYFNKVTDCGCFGDAIPLDPWESFTKDVILLVALLIINAGIKHIGLFLSSGLTKRIIVVATLVSLLFPLYTYRYLPIKDFRPYAEGNDIEKLMEVPEGELESPEIEMVFVYSKDGQEQEFGMDNLPTADEGWEFVRREDKVIREAYEPPVHDFVFYNMEGQEVTNVLLDEEGYKLLTIQYDLAKSDLSKMDDMKALSEKLKSLEISTYHATAAGKETIKELNSVGLTYWTADKTMLKTIIRSNPGLVLMKNSVIVKKWPSTRFPSFEDVTKYVED